MNSPSVESFSAPVTDGNVAAHAVSVTFIFSSDFVGTIEGVAFAGASDSSLNFRADAGERLTDIQYTVSAGTLRIASVR